MDLTFFTNGWSVLALFIVCWCINEIIKNIVFGISVTRSIAHLKDIPNDQRGLIIQNLFNKKMKEMTKDESND